MVKKSLVLSSLVFSMSLLSLSVGAALLLANGPSPLRGYGFLGGDFQADEDTAESTWIDVAYGCHFGEPHDAPAALRTHFETAARTPNTKLFIVMSGAWQQRAAPECGFKKPWGDFDNTFKKRWDELIPVLKEYKNLIYVVKLFDEPDLDDHGGPNASDLEAAAQYIHQTVPGTKVTVNWFGGVKMNKKVPSTDWTSTTKGGDIAAVTGLAKLGKPMFLWWFNNEASPSAGAMIDRWNDIVRATYSSGVFKKKKFTRSEIAGVGWCCDAIENYSGPNNNNSLATTILVGHVGDMTKTEGDFDFPNFFLIDNDFLAIGRTVLNRDYPEQGTVTYARRGNFPPQVTKAEPLAKYYGTIEPALLTKSYPSAAYDNELDRVFVSAVDMSGNVHMAVLRTDGSVAVPWGLQGGVVATGKPAIRFVATGKNSPATLVQAVRSTSDDLYVRTATDTNPGGSWTYLELGGAKVAKAPIFVKDTTKTKVGVNVRLLVETVDRRILSRTFNSSSGWSGAWEQINVKTEY